MRIYSLATLTVLAACQSAPAVEDKVAQSASADRIDCALNGARAFDRACALERGEGDALTLRHADGGFRKLTIDPDGLIDTADGGDPVTAQTLDDGRTQLTVGPDRYRLPAKL